MNDAETLRQTLAALRTELVRLHIEEQELLHFTGPNLRRVHLVALGALELRRLRAEHTVRRLRRKSELLHAASLTPVPDLTAIEHQLDLEFAAWRQRIRTFEDEITAANRTLENLMTDAADAEFKNLFRALVEKLHPDLRRTTDPLWPRINEAFARHDPAALRALEVLARELKIPDLPDDPAEEKRLADCVRNQLKKIAKLRDQQPLSLEPFLADNHWVEHRRREIEAETDMLETQAENLAARLAQLLPAFTRTHPFGRN